MDSSRNRFRREDPDTEETSSSVSEVDFRLVSIEDELKTVSLSSAMQARDFQALRAKVEGLESKSGSDISGTLGRLCDHVEAQDDRIEQLFDRLQVIENHVEAFSNRLDNLGEIGPLENLPGLLEQSLVTSLDDLEARLELRIEAVEQKSTGDQNSKTSEEDFELLRGEIESRARALREGVDKLLEHRHEEVLEMIQATQVEDPRVEEIQAQLERVQASVQEGALSPAISSPNSDDVTALAGEMAVLKERIEGLGNKLEGLGPQGDLEEKLEEALRFAQSMDAHQDKLDQALKAVAELEEKTGGLGAAVGSETKVVLAADDGLAQPPGETQLKLTLRDLVREMVKNRVSDLHIKTGRAITARIGRELIQFSTPPLSPADSYHLISSALRSSHRKRLVEERDIEFIYQYESIRLRANVFFDRGNLSATFKMLSSRPPELESLGLPKSYIKLLGGNGGLLVVCGLPGSGRSTTLTASLDFLNRTRQLHLVSLEDRLDYTHEDRRSLVTQRELEADIRSYAQGVKRAIGQDCDVIFVSELQDRQTLEEVFEAVEEGVLVVAGMTAKSVNDAVPRLMSLFPDGERGIRASHFSRCLLGIMSLRLYERADGEGLIPASELLIATKPVRQCIEDGKISELEAILEAGGKEGMQSFADSIGRLVETGLMDEALGRSELKRLKTGSSAAPSRTVAPRIEAKPVVQQAATAGWEDSTPVPSTEPALVEEKAPEPVAPQAPREEAAFGEEDTLMNWL